MMQDRAARHVPKGEIDRIGFFGKLPTHGDFVGWGLPVELQRLLQDWLQSGLQSVRDGFGDAWLSSFKAMPPWRFIVEEGLWSSQALAGVLMPSADRVGRSFPLVILSQIHASADHPFQLYKDESWFTAVEAIAESSLRRDFQLETFTTALHRLRRLRPLDAPGDIPRAFARTTKETLWWTVATDTKKVQGFRKPGPPLGDDFLRMISPQRIEPQQSEKINVEEMPRVDAVAVPTPLPKHRSTLLWQHAFHTHAGTRQRLNCDALLASNAAGLFAIADGLGDTSGAAEAAKLAIHLAGQSILEGPLETRLQEVKGKLGRANSLLRSKTDTSATSVPASASMALLILDEDSFAALWCGNTRCYLLRDGMLRCLTRDHVQVSMKRSLMRAVGLNATFHGDHVLEDLRENDCFFLCSAPLTRALPERAIAEIMLSEPYSEVPRILIENALIAGGPDNMTSLIVHVEAG